MRVVWWSLVGNFFCVIGAVFFAVYCMWLHIDWLHEIFMLNRLSFIFSMADETENLTYFTESTVHFVHLFLPPFLLHTKINKYFWWAKKPQKKINTKRNFMRLNECIILIHKTAFFMFLTRFYGWYLFLFWLSCILRGKFFLMLKFCSQFLKQIVSIFNCCVITAFLYLNFRTLQVLFYVFRICTVLEFSRF